MMPSYRNGYVPEDLLVIFNRGYNSVDGNWYWGLPAATYAKHRQLLRLAKKRTGRDLSISDGWGTYRPYAAQVIARRIYGNGAATPGTSSHGMLWEGRQTAAMDYSNWGQVYDWNRAAFYEDVRAAGLEPGLIRPDRNPTYPDEPWHVVDLDPWGAVPSFEGADPFSPGEEDDMFSDADRERLSAVYAALFGPKNLNNGQGPNLMSWVNAPAGDSQQAYYGVLPIVIYSQTLIAQLTARQAALTEALKQAGSGGPQLDLAAVQKAAEAGARAAMEQFPTVEQIADAVNDDAADRMKA